MIEEIAKKAGETLVKGDNQVINQVANASYKAGQKLGDKVSDGIDWLVDSIFG